MEKKKIRITKTQLYIACIIADTLGLLLLKYSFNLFDSVVKSVFKEY